MLHKIRFFTALQTTVINEKYSIILLKANCPESEQAEARTPSLFPAVCSDSCALGKVICKVWCLVDHFINYVIYRKLAVAFITVERTAVDNVNIHWSHMDSYRYFKGIFVILITQRGTFTVFSYLCYGCEYQIMTYMLLSANQSSTFRWTAVVNLDVVVHRGTSQGFHS